ncbi:hypothetical protein [Metabacillus bambusae]|uniref:SnoaL-like domain-containing protein n=1 Tax=Metabacillus bambusae TaxID=2795218 RepID=A0ABS3NBE3_9BACI|nr:hypothetical protein [Metabacillus bambusae]MBO1515503.1 hypothetical protein [Metabacillus bambusae]
MDKTTLVEKDFAEGAILIKELDKAHINVHSAFWLYNTEEDNWRLVIASKVADFSSPRRAYSQIKRVLKRLESIGDSIDFSLENISVISPNHQLIKILSTVVTTGPDQISGMRVTRNRIGNSYIEDAFIYRIQD